MKPHLVLHTRVVTGTGGGPDKTILHSPRYLEDDGYRMLCAYMRHPDDPLFRQLELRAQEQGARLLAVDDFGPLDWRLPGRLLRICREHRPVIWHGHDYKSNLLGLLVRRSFPMTLVTTVHGWVRRTHRTPLYYAIDRHCLPRYDEVICVSGDLHDRCLRIGVSPERCRLVENAIDLEEYRRRGDRRAAKERRGIPPSRLLIGVVGRLSAEKGLNHLLPAISVLVARGVDCELWIAGEGSDARALTERITALGLVDRVKLLGFRSDCRDLYEAMDVFALPSLREGLPNALLEAMAFELPTVATPVGGIPRLIVNGVNGILVEAASADALVDALERLAQDGELRSRLGRAARKTIEESYGFHDRMQRIRSVYDRALGRCKAAA